MPPSPIRKETLLELILAGSLTAIGIVAWQNGPLDAFAATAGGVALADVGKGLVANLMARGFKYWRKAWPTEQGVLNEHISWALHRAFEDALGILTRDWKADRHFVYLENKAPATAELTLSALKSLMKDASKLFADSDRMEEIVKRGEIASLLDPNEDGVHQFLAKQLGEYLHGHDPQFVMFVEGRLPKELQSRFLVVIRASGEKSEQAGRAISNLWRVSTTESLASLSEDHEEFIGELRETRSDLSEDLEEINNALSALSKSWSAWQKDWVEKQPALHDSINRDFISAMEEAISSVSIQLRKEQMGGARSNRESYLNSILDEKKRREQFAYVPLSGTSTSMTTPLEGDIYIPPELDRTLRTEAHEGVDTRATFRSIDEAFRLYSQLLILGPPGSGKTLLLEKMLYGACEGAIKDPSKPLPVLIKLKDWSNNINGVMALINDQLELHNLQKVHPSELILLLDGVNEIPQERRAASIVALAAWLEEHDDVRSLVSCRSNYHLSEFPETIPAITIKELDNEKIEQYLKDSLGEVNGTVVFRKLKPDPETKTRRDAIHLARNPFFLAMIAYTFNPEMPDERIPSAQGALFELFVKTLYARETDRETLRGWSLAKLSTGLGAVSYAMHHLGVVSRKMDVRWAAKQLPRPLRAERRDLWRIGQEMSILRLAKEGKFIEFRHDLLAEYFAAEHLSETTEGLVALIDRPQFNKNGRLPGTWDDVILMLVGISHPDEVIPIVTSIDPFLAAKCFDHVSLDSPLLQKTVDAVVDRLTEYLISEDKFAQKEAAKTLSRLPHQERVCRRMSQLMGTEEPFNRRRAIEVLRNSTEKVYAATSIATSLFDKDRWVRREAADALVELGDSAVGPLQKLFERSDQANERCQIVEAVSLIPTVSSTRIVLEALGDPDPRVSKTARKALDLSDIEMAYATSNVVTESQRRARAMLVSSDRSERNIGIQVLGALGTPEDTLNLLAIVNRNDPRTSELAIEMLGMLGGKCDTRVVDELIDVLLHYPTWPPRPSPPAAAAEALGLIGDESAIPMLGWALESPNPHVRSSAAQALGRLQAVASVDQLIERVNRDDNQYVIANCALSLGLIGDTGAAPTLVSLIYDQEMAYERVRGYAAYGLGFLADRDTMDEMLIALEDPDHMVRQSTAIALGLARWPEICDALHQVIKYDEVHYVRQWAALSLGAIGSEDSLPGLECALEDSNDYVRHKAVAALKEVQHPRASALLASVIGEGDQFIRQQAAIGLGVLEAKDHLTRLLGLCFDPNEHVRAAAAWAMGRIGESQAIPYLIRLSSDRTSHIVRERAVEALGQLGEGEAAIVEALVVATQDPSDFVRRHAVSALGKQRATDRVHLIKQIVNKDRSAYVRRAAHQVLQTSRFQEAARASPEAETDKSGPALNQISLAAPRPRKGENDKNNAEWIESPADQSLQTTETDSSFQYRGFSHIQPASTAVEQAMHTIGEGEIHQVFKQAFLDPRAFKRHTARMALWSQHSKRPIRADTAETVEQISGRLGETEAKPIAQIQKIVEYCGAQFSMRMLDRAIELEAGEGMMVNDGSRGRPPGGVFFQLVRKVIDPDTRRVVFSKPGSFEQS